MAGSYSDIKTNLSQVGLDWDLPTGLSLVMILFWNCENLVKINVNFRTFMSETH